jgi:hypothetical protein
MDNDPRDEVWPVGFEGHELDQLRRAARWPMWQKLRCLQEMGRLARRLHGAALNPPAAFGTRQS